MQVVADTFPAGTLSGAKTPHNATNKKSTKNKSCIFMGRYRIYGF
jgi:hypothetical protein